MSAKEKNKGGRPTKLTPLIVEQIYFLASFGHKDKDIAYLVGITEETLNQWKKDPKFSESLKTCKDKIDSKVENSLFRRALGFETKETVCFVIKGKIVTKEIPKIYPPDATSMIFWLKNRKKAEWRDRVETAHDVTDELMDKFKDVTTEELIAKSRLIASRLITFSAN